MKVETLSAPVEQFTIAIEKNPAGKGGLLVDAVGNEEGHARLQHDVDQPPSRLRRLRVRRQFN